MLGGISGQERAGRSLAPVVRAMSFLVVSLAFLSKSELLVTVGRRKRRERSRIARLGLLLGLGSQHLIRKRNQHLIHKRKLLKSPRRQKRRERSRIARLGLLLGLGSQHLIRKRNQHLIHTSWSSPSPRSRRLASGRTGNAEAFLLVGRGGCTTSRQNQPLLKFLKTSLSLHRLAEVGKSHLRQLQHLRQLRHLHLKTSPRHHPHPHPGRGGRGQHLRQLRHLHLKTSLSLHRLVEVAAGKSQASLAGPPLRR